MAYTTPRTWVTSDFADAMMLNEQIRDNLLAIYNFTDTTLIPGSTIMPLKCDSLGGTDSHRPVVNGTIYSQWHLANGDADIDGLGYTAPDLRNKIPIGAGVTYAQGATGGATTADNSHTHAAGTLETTSTALVNHTHGWGVTTGGPSGADTGSSTPANVSGSAHSHDFSLVSGNPTTNPTHTHTADGDTASGGSAAQDIMPPYVAEYYFLYIGS